ncbi:MAG: hypothetical protein ACOX3R_14900 [Desulfitobacteriia bacterium]|jgi:hypothetical protein
MYAKILNLVIIGVRWQREVSAMGDKNPKNIEKKKKKKKAKKAVEPLA